MYNFRWSILQIEGYKALDGIENVVGKVHWELEVRDSVDHSIHYMRGVTELDKPAGSGGFIDFLELDNDIVLGWVWNIIGKEETEAKIVAELDAMREPPPTQLTVLPMPWAAACCPDGTGMDTGGMPTGMPPPSV